MSFPGRSVSSKRRQLHNNALLLRFPDLVSGFSINLFLPPKGIALNRKRRDRMPFHLVRVFWFCVRQTLPEGQNIRLSVRVFCTCVNQPFRVLDVLDTIPAPAWQSAEFRLQLRFSLTINFHCGDTISRSIFMTPPWLMSLLARTDCA